MKRFILLAAGLALSLCLSAQKPKPYLDVNDIPDAVVFLPPPPELGSPAHELDEARYEWGKTQRHGRRGRQARREGTVDVDTMAMMFSAAFGMELSESRTPRTMHLLRRSVRTFRLSAVRPKATYMRKRPYVVHEEGTMIPEHEDKERNTGSYPSGHTVRGWGMALVLSQIDPDRQNQLLTAGYEWGQSRVIAGYHWQSDVNASYLLASACFARLQSCPEYLADLLAARDEIQALKKAMADEVDARVAENLAVSSVPR